MFANIKYQMIDWGNSIDNVKWFGKDKNKTFGFFLDEKDRQCVINEYPEVAIRSAKIQPPLTKKTIIKETDDHGNNIMWIGMIKTENSNKSADEALNLAEELKDVKSSQKVMFVVSCAPKNEQLVINVIKKVYPNFQPDIEDKLINECHNDKKNYLKEVEKQLNDYIEMYKPNSNYNIEFHLDCDEKEIDDIARKCQYLYKPEARGFTETASSFIQAIGRGLIVLTDYGYCTEKDYKNGGRFSNAVILGEKYKKDATNYEKAKIRLTGDKAYEKIIELESDKEKKEKTIKAVNDLYKRKFKPNVVKKLTQLHIDTIDSENFDSKTTDVNNLLNNKNIATNLKNEELFYIKSKEKYNKTERKNYLIREKMVQIKNICFELMAELGLEIDDVVKVFDTAKRNNGFTNSKKAMKEIENDEKAEKLKEFSVLFQYYTSQNDILSPRENKNGDRNQNVGLRTKRVLDIFGSGDNLKNFLTKNTSRLELNNKQADISNINLDNPIEK